MRNGSSTACSRKILFMSVIYKQSRQAALLKLAYSWPQAPAATCTMHTQASPHTQPQHGSCSLARSPVRCPIVTPIKRNQLTCQPRDCSARQRAAVGPSAACGGLAANMSGVSSWIATLSLRATLGFRASATSTTNGPSRAKLSLWCLPGEACEDDDT
jgi:hypothetical protein